MKPVSKTLRVGAGESSSREVDLSLAKPKAKKGYMDIFYHETSDPFIPHYKTLVKTTIYSGIRYLQKELIPPMKYHKTKG